MKTQLIKWNPKDKHFVTSNKLRIFFKDCESCDYVHEGVQFTLCKIQDNGMYLIHMVGADHAKVTFINI